MLLCKIKRQPTSAAAGLSVIATDTSPCLESVDMGPKGEPKNTPGGSLLMSCSLNSVAVETNRSKHGLTFGRHSMQSRFKWCQQKHCFASTVRSPLPAGGGSMGRTGDTQGDGGSAFTRERSG